MSKNLETEYKELLNSELPDLWARIEAGISEEASTSNELKEPIMINEETEEQFVKTEEQSEQRGIKLVEQLKEQQIKSDEQLSEKKDADAKAPALGKNNWKHIIFRSAKILAAGIFLALLFPLFVILPRLTINSDTVNSAEESYYDVGGAPCEDYAAEMGADSAMPEEWTDDVESVVASVDDSEEEMAEDTDGTTEGTTQEAPVTNETQSEDSESAILEEEWTNEMTVEIQSPYLEREINGYYAYITLLDGVEQPQLPLVFLRFATEEELQAFGGESELVATKDLEEGVTYEIWYLPTEESVTEVPIYIILDWK